MTLTFEKFKTTGLVKPSSDLVTMIRKVQHGIAAYNAALKRAEADLAQTLRDATQITADETTPPVDAHDVLR